IPQLNDSFQIITFGSSTGSFSSTNGIAAGYGHLFRVNYRATNVTLVVTSGGPPTLLSPALTNGLFRLRWQGEAGATYGLEASTNLLPNSWMLLLITNTPSGIFDFVDPQSANLPQRFYRARTQ